MSGGSPFLTEDRIQSEASSYGPSMSVQGTINRAGLLMCITVATAGYTWTQYGNGNDGALALAGISGLVGFFIALLTAFNPSWSPFTSIPYAVLEGMFLGTVSGLIQAQVEQPIVVPAITLTFGILVATLILYSMGIGHFSSRVQQIIITATAGVALVYLVSFGASMFGYQVPMIHDTGLFGIGFSVFVVILATLNLFLDFDMIEHGGNVGAPKYMEWYCALSLLITIVWLYLEVLRLLSKLNRR